MAGAFAVGSLAIVAVTSGLSTRQLGLTLPNLQADDLGTAVSLAVAAHPAPTVNTAPGSATSTGPA